MCIRDRYQRRVRGRISSAIMGCCGTKPDMTLLPADPNSDILSVNSHQNECKLLVQKLWAHFSAHMALDHDEVIMLFDSFVVDRGEHRGLDKASVSALLTAFVQVYLAKIQNSRAEVARNAGISTQQCSMLYEKLSTLTAPRRANKLAAELIEKADSNENNILEWEEFVPFLRFMYEIIGTSDFLGPQTGVAKSEQAEKEDEPAAWSEPEPAASTEPVATTEHAASTPPSVGVEMVALDEDEDTEGSDQIPAKPDESPFEDMDEDEQMEEEHEDPFMDGPIVPIG
eukprot:TRINITY_DN4915_c0_g1_i3.p1 TRINITY_DN4915_c0_g1~~TRINITY_DN4915_c0_g1_i3.p1  ORF type:complete len:285 (-),score=80.53 TRINITY_DN4915_c0_g1_i3:639-1493(-)